MYIRLGLMKSLTVVRQCRDCCPKCSAFQIFDALSIKRSKMQRKEAFTGYLAICAIRIQARHHKDTQNITLITHKLLFLKTFAYSFLTQ